VDVVERRCRIAFILKFVQVFGPKNEGRTPPGVPRYILVVSINIRADFTEMA
jgi:hypothetical protein